jgi:hypothetical protein
LAKIGGAVLLRGDFQAESAVRLYGAEITGNLECDGGHFKNAGGEALTATLAKIGGTVILRSKFQAEGAVRLYGAEIGGSLECDGGQFNNAGDDALNADLAKIGGAVLLRGDFQAEGAVRLYGAEIGGNLECDGGQFKNAGGEALNADVAKIRGAVLLRNKFQAEGEVRLHYAEVGGSLECDTGQFKNAGGAALMAEAAKIGGAVLLRNNFQAEGEVQLDVAEIGAPLECDGGSFKNAHATALNIEGARIGAYASLGDGFKAEGKISGVNAVIGGDLFVGYHEVESKGGADFSAATLDARGATIKGALSVVGMKSGPKTAVNLSGASCEVLTDASDSTELANNWPAPAKLTLDGFTYLRIERPESPGERLDWLRRQLPADTRERRGRFRPQPYTQLAHALRAQGHDDEAKDILIGMAEDRRKWSNLSRASRAWQWVLWKTIRNGHRPLRALYALIILWVIGFAAFGWGYQKHVMLPSEKEANQSVAGGQPLPGHYEPFCAPVYAIDASLPIISFGQRERWHPREALKISAQGPAAQRPTDGWVYANLCEAGFMRRWDPRDQWAEPSTLARSLAAFRWIYIALGWSFTTMLVAGISGLVGRPAPSVSSGAGAAG